MNEKTMAILVHGVNVWDGGRGSVGQMRSFFAVMGIPYIMVDYGHTLLPILTRKNDRVAKLVADACLGAQIQGYKVIVVGHSNGCAITHRAGLIYGAPIDLAIYINPALDKDAIIPDSITELHVWHSPSDRPVKWAKWIPKHPWGEMGAVGYMGDDERVTNFNKQFDYTISSHQHSDMFSPDKLAYFAPLIINHALKRL